MCTCVCVCSCVPCVPMCICVHVCTCICTCVPMCVMCVMCVYTCMHMCMHVYVCTCMHVCACTDAIAYWEWRSTVASYGLLIFGCCQVRESASSAHCLTFPEILKQLENTDFLWFSQRFSHSYPKVIPCPSLPAQPMSEWFWNTVPQICCSTLQLRASLRVLKFI